MSHFYGWTPEVIKKMSFKEAFIYLKAMEVIKADESLNAMQISSVPHMKKEASKKLIKGYGTIIKSNMEQGALAEDKVMTTTEFADYLKGKLNG